MKKEKLVLPESPKVKRTNFKGSPYYNLSVMKYLKKKYNKCACVVIPKICNIDGDFEHTDVSLRWVQTSKSKGVFSIPDKFWKYFDECQNKRFVLFPFGFTCLNKLGHANYIIYDKKMKTMERFEPYGKAKRKCANPNNLDDRIKKLFNDKLSKDDKPFIEKYYKPLDYLPKKGPQRVQEDEKEMDEEIDAPGGYCPAWSSFYVELRLLNPNTDRKKLIKKFYQEVENSKLSFTEFIRNYSQYLVEKTKNI